MKKNQSFKNLSLQKEKVLNLTQANQIKGG